MKIFSSVRAAFVLGLVVLGMCSSAYAETDILFVLDASGSMREKIEGQRKIDTARAALIKALTEVPAGSHVGLRLYGHRVDQRDKVGSCKDSELAIPVSALQRDNFESAVSNLSPLGYTPISYSLEQARNDFSVERESEKVIILLSDGEETCGGSPKAVVQELIKNGFKVKIHTIGFDVGDLAESQLRDIATASGGEYFGVKKAADLSSILSKVTKDALVIKKQKVLYGTTIRGGDTFETAVPFQLGTEFRLDHVQKKADFDYLYFDAEAGEHVTLTLRTLDQAVSVDSKGKVVTGVNPVMRVALVGPDFGRISSSQVSGQFDRDSNTHRLPTTGRYFLLVGSDSSEIPTEGGLFQLQRKVLADIGGDKDAGASYATALPIVPGRYDKSYFNASEDRDIYSFQAKKGESYSLVVVPEPGTSESIQLVVTSDLGDKISSKSESNTNPVKTGSFVIPEDGVYYITISSCCFTKPHEYGLVFKKDAAPEVVVGE